jgi:hypothetical protein
MSWQNANDWFIDHILPFHPREPIALEEQIRRFHWTNIRPMWHIKHMHTASIASPVHIQSQVSIPLLVPIPSGASIVSITTEVTLNIISPDTSPSTTIDSNIAPQKPPRRILQK